MDLFNNFHLADIYSAVTRTVIGLIGAGIIWVIQLLFGIRNSVRKVEAENKDLKEKLGKLTFENVLLADTKREYKQDLDRVLVNNRRLQELVEKQGQQIEELVRENTELKRRVAELEAVSPVEAIQRRGTGELKIINEENKE